jgi:hypothetical protein
LLPGALRPHSNMNNSVNWCPLRLYCILLSVFKSGHKWFWMFSSPTQTSTSTSTAVLCFWSSDFFFPQSPRLKFHTHTLHIPLVFSSSSRETKICTHPPPRPRVESHLRLARGLAPSTHPLSQVAWIQSKRSTHFSTLRPSTKALTAALPSSHSGTVISDRGLRVQGCV